jgi:hypothetical protein
MRGEGGADLVAEAGKGGSKVIQSLNGGSSLHVGPAGGAGEVWWLLSDCADE